MEESPTQPAAAGDVLWPRKLGAVGCFLALLMFVDHLGDLGPLSWSQQRWVDTVGADLAGRMVQWANPDWVVPTSLAGMALGIFLLIASINLRRERRLGVVQSQAWSWLAIALLAVETTRGLVWVVRNYDVLAAFNNSTQWYEYIVGVVVIAGVLYPVFLLVFLSRPSVRAQYTGWPA